MDEFLRLNWRAKEASELEQRVNFLTEQSISDSYIYKNFTNPLKNNTTSVKLSNITKYVPGKKNFNLVKRRSLLTRTEQSHCLKALKLHQSGKSAETMTEKEKFSLGIYMKCQHKLVTENKLFADFVKHKWDLTKDKQDRIRPSFLNYATHQWEHKIGAVKNYPQFYKVATSINLNYDESEYSVSFQHDRNLLETGSLARFSKPNLIDICLMKVKTLPRKEDRKLTSKLPVSADENINKLVENGNIDVVISSSALKTITSCYHDDCNWIIPVVVKDVVPTSSDNAKQRKKVVYIDKTLPKLTPSYHDLNYYAFKKLVRSNFCRHEAFKFPQSETAEETKQEETNDEETKKSTNWGIKHNVSYRLWKISRDTNLNSLMKTRCTNQKRTINLLVRCKLDGAEATELGVLQPVVVQPKLERQLQYGANIPTKADLSKEWTALFFRLYSTLYRARIFGPQLEVISVEKCSLQNINSQAFAFHEEFKPHLQLGVLEKVMQGVLDLVCGSDSNNFLLQYSTRQPGFVSLLSKDKEGSNDGFDLHSFYDRNNFKVVSNNSTKSWIPIDMNYVLPVHEEYDLMPGTFAGTFNTDKFSNKKKKKKKKNKHVTVSKVST